MISYVVIIAILTIVPLYFRKSILVRIVCVWMLVNIFAISILILPDAVSRGLLKDETRMHDAGFLLGVQEMRKGMEARLPMVITPLIALAVLSVVAVKPKKVGKTD